MGGVSWKETGLCRPGGSLSAGELESFFAETSAGRKEAKAACGRCPVREACLVDALERGEIWGVWGGCDEVDLRRALWTDTNGTERERLRFPRCPSCRARTEVLFVRSECRVSGGGEVESVECGACQFSWSVPSSVAAIKTFWARQQGLAEPVAMRKPMRARVARGKLPSGRPSGVRSPNLSRTAPAAPNGDLGSLAASAAPGADPL